MLVIGAGSPSGMASDGAAGRFRSRSACALVVTITGGIYAGFVQTFIVTPNELDKEQPFIKYNIAATRKAFALDRVDERELSGDARAQAARTSSPTPARSRTCGCGTTSRCSRRSGRSRRSGPTTTSSSVDNDRYSINGQYRQVMLSARELNTESLPNRTWVNERLTFTHGYGLTLGPVNQVTTEGLPVLFIRDLPPVSTSDLKIDEPSIYFGELSNDYVIVQDAPAGVPLPARRRQRHDDVHGHGRRADRQLLAAAAVRAAIRHRPDPVHERHHGRQPDPLPPADRASASASSRRSCRTTPIRIRSSATAASTGSRTRTRRRTTIRTRRHGHASGGVNYIRNSVKIVIDAYNGTTTFYLAEPNDPIALTLGEMFPGMLRPLSRDAGRPAAARAVSRGHLRDPGGDLRDVPHDEPAVFYNKEDQWQVPTLDTGAECHRRCSRTTRSCGCRARSRRSSSRCCRSRRAPRTTWRRGWSRAATASTTGTCSCSSSRSRRSSTGRGRSSARINQDQVISPQITLWNQQGSEVIWGTLLVIPVEESLIYVRPLYLRSPEGRIPELKRVIVAYQSQIVMAETLNQALDSDLRPRHRAALCPGSAPEQRDVGRAGVVGDSRRRDRRAWEPDDGGAGGGGARRTSTARSRRSATATGRPTATRSRRSATCSTG